LVLLAALAVFNAFDLALTASQLPRGNFLEANVVAAALVHDPHAMVAFKVVLFTIGAALLYRFRRTVLSEVAGWGLVACYGLLMVWWDAYLDAVEVCLADPAIVTEVVRF
jgi:hypothetical protein